MLIENRRGNYAFVKGIAPYSAGAVAAPGYEIVRVRLQQPKPLEEGFDFIERYMRVHGRRIQSLCGMELRSPKPFSFQGFADFNAGYVAVLKRWDVLVNGVNPVARTNVAPELGATAEPALYAFSHTAPAPEAARTFVVAGAGELPEGSLDPHEVVRRGEDSPDALAEKIRFVMGLMSGRLKELGVAWPAVTAIDAYTVHDFHASLPSDILGPAGRAGLHGVTWHFARPPIVGLEYEMDVRGCRREIMI